MQVEELKEFPDQCFHVDVDGSFRKTMRPNARMSISQYWGSQSQKIGLLLAGSTLVLLGILLYETDVLQFFWEIVVSIFWFIFNSIMGVLF